MVFGVVCGGVVWLLMLWCGLWWCGVVVDVVVRFVAVCGGVVWCGLWWFVGT